MTGTGLLSPAALPSWSSLDQAAVGAIITPSPEAASIDDVDAGAPNATTC
jgi:hypothetical protein